MLCTVGKVSKKHTQRRDNKVGATRLKGVAGYKRGASGQEEDDTKIRGSRLGETAASPPQERRNRPSSHPESKSVGLWGVLEIPDLTQVPTGRPCCR